MKYFLPGIALLAAGFFAGYLFPVLNEHVLEEPVRKPPGLVERNAERSTEQSAERNAETSADPRPEVVNPADRGDSPGFDAIARQPTIFDKLYVAHQIAANASPAELESLLNETINHQDPLYAYNIASILIERWTAFDPEGALEFITAHPRMNQQSFQTHVMTSWARHDPKSALDHFKQMDNRQIKFAVGARLLEDSTLDWLSGEIEEELGPYAEQLARQIRLRRTPPREAFHEGLSMTGSERRRTLTEAATRWARADPDAAMAAIANLRNQRERRAMMQIVLSRQIRVDANKALALLGLYASGDTKLEQRVLQGFAHSDPLKALPYVERYTDATGRIGVLTGLLSTWIQSDPTAALNYASMLSGERRRSVYQAMAAGYARSHPEDALHWVLNLGPEFQAVKKMTLGSISRSHTELAAQTVDRIRDPELRVVLIEQVVDKKSQQDASDAMDWITRNTRAGSETRHSAIATVIRHLGHRAPDRALQLIDRLPRGAIRQNVSRSLAHRWASQEPSRAEEIISRLELNQDDAQRLRERLDRQPSQKIHQPARYQPPPVRFEGRDS